VAATLGDLANTLYNAGKLKEAESFASQSLE
jgi:hypothetical protein